MNNSSESHAPILVPECIEGVIQRFEQATEPFTAHDVQQALSEARQSPTDNTTNEKFSAWTEVLAFALVAERGLDSPWGTYFAPIGSGTNQDGNPAYFPDIADANVAVINHWVERARQLEHPVLKARYADLVWDLAPTIAKVRRDADMARLAIDAYLTSAAPMLLSEVHERIYALLRAFDLANSINDIDRLNIARKRLIEIQREVVDAEQGFWWLIFDRLIEDRNAGLNDEQQKELINGLEGLVAVFGNTSDAEKFDPHALEGAASRLIGFYRRHGDGIDVRRLNVAIAHAFEHFASLADAMLASSVLQTAVNAYREAGLAEESQRVRVLMEEKIRRSRDEMGQFSTEDTVSREDMEKFCDTLVVDDVATSFARMANEFLPKREHLEKQSREMQENAPLMAFMPLQIVADDHVAANVGSVEDDPLGRLLHQMNMGFHLSHLWLQHAINRLIEKHQILPDHITAWANRLEIYDDTTFIREGVQAWFAGDLVKALYVLVPQVERGLRGIVSQLGRPVTKAHPSVASASVALTMGDILYNPAIAESLGSDLTQYFSALYADPRGFNLRNQVAHGLIKPEEVSEHLINLVIHTFLIMGIWRELANNSR